MNYALLDWYRGFPVRNLYVRMIEEALETHLEFVANPERADIILCGPYGARHHSRDVGVARRSWKLFVTGEPANADYLFVHHSLSFDPLDYGGRNFRFPVWMYEMSWYPDISSTFSRDETDELLHRNRPIQSFMSNWKDRQRKVVSIFNNRESRRTAIFSALEQREMIDGFGKPFGTAGAHDYRQKCDVISNYRVNKCLENCVYHGYYTEKILHARACGCVPLTWCDFSVGMDFNERAIVNLYDFKHLSDVVDRVQSLLSDDHLCWSLVDQPVFATTPDIRPAVDFIRRAYHQFCSGELPNMGEYRFAEPNEYGYGIDRAVKRPVLNKIGRALRKIGHRIISYSLR